MFRFSVLLLVLNLLFAPVALPADTPAAMTPGHLAGTSEKLVTMRAAALRDIERLDRAIEQNNRSIAKSEDIIRQAQAKGNAEAERIARQARSQALEAKRKNEAARAAAEMRRKRADEALQTVNALLAKASDDGVPFKVDCAALLKRWQDDPARRASQDCECFHPERAPMCVPKGTKMPEIREGSYAFYWIVEIRTSVGTMNVNDGMHTGKYRTSDEAIRGCEDDARRTVSPPDHVANVVCVPTMWPGPETAARAPRKPDPPEPPPATPPKIDCAQLLKERLNDPGRSAAEDCKCFHPERPPICVPKGTTMPEVKEGSYTFYWVIEIRTPKGTLNINDGTHSGKYKTSDEAIRSCEEAARRTVDPLDQVVKVACVPTMWPEVPQAKTPKPPPQLKQGKF